MCKINARAAHKLLHHAWVMSNSVDDPAVSAFAKSTGKCKTKQKKREPAVVEEQAGQGWPAGRTSAWHVASMCSPRCTAGGTRRQHRGMAWRKFYCCSAGLANVLFCVTTNQRMVLLPSRSLLVKNLGRREYNLSYNGLVG
jgi:hypothetical protein